MLKELRLKKVGPADELLLKLKLRLNLITGDNGLGKSFLLDIAWWAMTRRWPHALNKALVNGYVAKPESPKQGSIEFTVQGKTGRDIRYKSTFSARDEAWTGKAGRPHNPGLVLYAMADGGFGVWDPPETTGRKSGNRMCKIAYRPTYSAQEMSGMDLETQTGANYAMDSSVIGLGGRKKGVVHLNSYVPF